MRTLGAAEIRCLQALRNGGSELRIGLWSPACGGGIVWVTRLGLTVRMGVKVRVAARVKTNVRPGVRVSVRAGSV